MAGWLAARAVPHTWLSLDPGDNDAARFLRYLIAALAAVRPGLEDDSALIAGPDANAGLDFVGAALIDAIAASDDPFVLILDDYHVITNGAVHEVVRFLIAHGPPFAHLVVLTREDPPFPLARLRAHGRLVELRADELRYTDEEARRHFAEIAGLDLRAEDVARLLERTEGWIAGVQLAAISLQGSPDARALIDAFAGTQRFVLDYLASEVLAGLDPDLRAFLVRISVAERFTEALCRELSGRDDSAALLERAERLNLFLIPLDLERRWYRFHHLFADYLRTLVDDGTGARAPRARRRLVRGRGSHGRGDRPRARGGLDRTGARPGRRGRPGDVRVGRAVNAPGLARRPAARPRRREPGARLPPGGRLLLRRPGRGRGANLRRG